MMKRIVCFLMLAVLLVSGFTGCKKNAAESMIQEYILEDSEGFYDIPEAFTASVTADGTAYAVENKIKVVSYNIRCANDANGNSIKERAPRLEQVIGKYDPDIMGFQEFVPEWNNYVEPAFSDTYDYIIYYRSKDNYEGTPVFWKRNKFKLLDSGVFWLSETPDTESLGWDADYYRICSWIKLEVRATGKVFYYYNTHFDYTEPPQVPSAQLMTERVVADAPVIVTGDFNMTPKSKGYAAMTEVFADANTAGDTTATFTDYGTKEDPILIDYIFTKDSISENYTVMTEMPGGKYVSDHFGVYSEVIIL
ncbi:MAG: endonuclease/exonuclease/phosphatase family protein [Clostridia bacterium]|nr:endonuclease/exonuclease/phosphatase family protein [Clostridia bacterium]